MHTTTYATEAATVALVLILLAVASLFFSLLAGAIRPKTYSERMSVLYAEKKGRG